MVYIPTDKLSCSSNSNVITQENRQTLVLPSGCLADTVLILNCKSSEEEKYYTFDLKNRMLFDDEINSVVMYPNDDTLISKKISYENQIFTVLISGGKTINDIGINFLIKTLLGELLEFTCILPIRPEGILERGKNYNVIMGATGPAGKTDFTLNIGTVTTLEPDQKATANIVHGANGQDTLNLGLVKGDQGEKGDAGAQGIPGKDGTTSLDDGNANLSIHSLNSDNGFVKTDGDGNLTVLSINGSALIGNSKITLEQLTKLIGNTNKMITKYSNADVTYPLQFAPSSVAISSDAVFANSALTKGSVSMYGITTGAMPLNCTISVDFQISTTDTSDASYFIAGFKDTLLFAINPSKKIIQVYTNSTNIAYSVNWEDYGLKIGDGNYHTLHIFINNGSNGYFSASIDGKHFTRSYSSGNAYMASIIARSNGSTAMAENTINIKNLVMYDKVKYYNDFTLDGNDKVKANGFYPLSSNGNNSNSSSGFVLNRCGYNSVFDYLKLYYQPTQKSVFSSDGLVGGVASINTSYDTGTFTYECMFKFDPKYDTNKIIRKNILGNNSTFSIGIPTGGSTKLTFKNYTNNTELDIVDNIIDNEWHSLAIVSDNNKVSIYIDGIKKLVTTLNTNWNQCYIRALNYNDHIAVENSLIIKNITLNLNFCKYYNDYDPSQTPDMPTNGATAFYPLTDGINQNMAQISNDIEIILNEGDSFEYVTIPSGVLISAVPSLKTIKVDSVNSSNVVLNAQFNPTYIKNVVGSSIKRGIL